jgi:hypothetical protein
MGSIGISSIVFACVFGGLLGMFIRALLPQHHLSAELTQMSAKIILLDRLLAHYGPETRET